MDGKECSNPVVHIYEIVQNYKLTAWAHHWFHLHIYTYIDFCDNHIHYFTNLAFKTDNEWIID